ncbi:hypothetical protein [Aeribacillus pallidus]|uniref:hypothetical protein n=1 Tax=Aeribacillus pallidus TaxID=33936 RepID=UPI003D231F04
MVYEMPNARINFNNECHSLKPVPQTPRPPKRQAYNFKPVCEHKYQILDSNVENIYSEGKVVYSFVQATFYCEKCLDIKQINTTKSIEDEE